MKTCRKLPGPCCSLWQGASKRHLFYLWNKGRGKWCALKDLIERKFFHFKIA
nr:MAG TPA: hypothetical protein [Caudoviricetes sp.]